MNPDCEQTGPARLADAIANGRRPLYHVMFDANKAKPLAAAIGDGAGLMHHLKTIYKDFAEPESQGLLAIHFQYWRISGAQNRCTRI
jgi:hypothetical protein